MRQRENAAMPVPVSADEKKVMTMTVIALAIVIFWPAGIVILAVHLAVNRTHLFRASTYTLLGVAHWVLLALASLALYFALAQYPAAFFISGALCIGSLCTNIYAISLKIKNKKYRRYIALVVNQGLTDIGDIAKRTDTAHSKVISDLDKIISKGFLLGVELDKEQDEIIVLYHPHLPGSGAAMRQPYAKKCENCNANGWVVPGRRGTCEYCGSPLSE